MPGRLSWILPLALALSATAADPTLVRVVLLDTSGSMHGERMTAAKAELRELGRALPPAPDCPVIFVPFTDRLGRVVVCTDLASLEACLDRAEADGGTKISVALERALEELQKLPNCRHASVLLYTDGEDGDQEGINRQELRLDRLFADREKRGLHQSVIFCKRWQNANAGLLKQIRERGHARVLDAGEARLRPIALKPKVVCSRSSWAGESSLLLDIEFMATVDVVGGKDVVLPALPLMCVEAGASGDRTAELTAGQGKTIRLRIPVPLDSGGSLPVRFLAGEAQELLAGKDLILPQVTRDHLVVQVPIPLRGGAYTLRATATAGKDSRWLDPLARRARIPVEISVTVDTPKGETWIGPVRIQAKSTSGWSLPATTFSVTDSKPVRTRVTLDGRFPERMPSLGVPLEVLAIGTPPGVAMDPSSMNITADATQPPPVPVTLQHQVRNVGAARWIEPVQGLAAFMAEIELTVNGPLVPDSEILVRAPTGVRSVRFVPSTIRSGTQLIRFHIDAELRPVKSSRFKFELLPPKSSDVIDVQTPAPLELEIPGPTPLQVALLREGRITSHWSLELRNRGPCRLHVTPKIIGIDHDGLGAGTAVVRAGSSGLDWANCEGHAKIQEPCDIFVSVPPDRELSFFRDTYFDAELRVQTAVSSPALVGSTHTVRLRVEAPFKRYLFYVVGILAVGIALWFVGRTVYRIVHHEAPPMAKA